MLYFGESTHATMSTQAETRLAYHPWNRVAYNYDLLLVVTWASVHESYAVGGGK